MTEVNIHFAGPPLTPLTPEQRAQVASAIAAAAARPRGPYPYRSPAIDAGIARGLGMSGIRYSGAPDGVSFDAMADGLPPTDGSLTVEITDDDSVSPLSLVGQPGLVIAGVGTLAITFGVRRGWIEAAVPADCRPVDPALRALAGWGTGLRVALRAAGRSLAVLGVPVGRLRRVAHFSPPRDVAEYGPAVLDRVRVPTFDEALRIVAAGIGDVGRRWPTMQDEIDARVGAPICGREECAMSPWAHCQHVTPGSRLGPEPEWREVTCHGGVKARIPI